MYDPVDVSKNFSLKQASGLKGGCGLPLDPPLSNSNTCGFDQYIDFSEHIKMTCKIVFSAFAVLPRLGDIYPMTLPGHCSRLHNLAFRLL